MSPQSPHVLERLLFHADRVEECGHLNAARYMRLAAEELEQARAESAARLNVINAKIIERDDARLALSLFLDPVGQAVGRDK